MQTQAVRPRREATEQPAESTTEASPSAEKVKADADALLEEIDALLAEEMPAPERYTLADAIREGAKLAPQTFGAFRGQQGETCALSAAYDAIKARGLA